MHRVDHEISGDHFSTPCVIEIERTMRTYAYFSCRIDFQILIYYCTLPPFILLNPLPSSAVLLPRDTATLLPDVGRECSYIGEH